MTPEHYQFALDALITGAEIDGVVLTINLAPTQPLRMGGHKMVGHARPARVMAAAPTTCGYCGTVGGHAAFCQLYEGSAP